MSHETKESLSLILFHGASPNRNVMNNDFNSNSDVEAAWKEYWSKTTRGKEFIPEGKSCSICEDEGDSKCSLCSFSVCKNCHNYTPLREKVREEEEMHLLDGHQEILKHLPPELGRIVVQYLTGSPAEPIIYKPNKLEWYDPLINRMTTPLATTLCLNLLLYLISLAFGLGLAHCTDESGKHLIIFLIIYGIMGCIFFASLIRGSVLKGAQFRFFIASMGCFILFLISWMVCGSVWMILASPLSNCDSIASRVTLAVCVVSWVWAICVVSLILGYLCEMCQKRGYRLP